VSSSSTSLHPDPALSLVVNVAEEFAISRVISFSNAEHVTVAVDVDVEVAGRPQIVAFLDVVRIDAVSLQELVVDAAQLADGP
jgi:hypothetical protein